MTVSPIKARIDAFTNQVFPTRNTRDRKQLRIDNSSGAIKRAFLHFTLPDAVMRGANLQSAHLKFYPAVTAGATAGEVRRVTSAWKEGQITHNNSPSTTATGAVAFNETWTGEISLEVTGLIQGAVSAGVFHGLRITTSGSAVRRLYSSEAANDFRPVLEVVWNRAPLPPDDLAPSGGRAISVASPTMAWQFRSAFGEQTQEAFEVEVRDATTLVSVHDSGEILSTDPFYVLPVTLTASTDYEWRVRARDGSGLWSDFSDWVAFQYVGIGTVTITSPSAGEVNDPTPPFIWTYSGTQAEAAVTVFAKDSSGVYRYVHKLTRRTYTTFSYTPPRGVITSQDFEKYKVRIRVWPDVDYENISGAPNYAQDEEIFSFIKSIDTTAPSGLTATADAVIPKVDLAWSRATAPDKFLLLVDDEVIMELDPADVLDSGTSYAASYWGAIPDTEHTYELAAVVNNKTSTGNPTDTATVSAKGIWLVDVDEGTYVRIRDLREQQSETIGESGETVYPVGRRSPVRIRDSVRGREGGVSGVVTNETFLSASNAEALLRQMNEDFGRLRYISPPNRNFPVHVFNLSAPPDSEVDGRFAVSFDFEQVGQF